MKRILSLIQILLVLSLSIFGSFASAADNTGFDIEGIGNSGFNIQADSENGYYIIDNGYGCVLESDRFIADPGSFEFSQILAYEESENFWRGVMWVCFGICSGELLSIDSVSFKVGTKEYTFTNLFSEDSILNYGAYLYQNIRILIGYNNQEFITALFDLIKDCTEDELYDLSMPVTLHGQEDIEVSINGVSIIDILSMHEAMQQYGGSISEIVGTEMSTTEIQ